MNYETQSFPLEVKGLHEDGTFEGYAAVFGNKDRGGDVIEPGAFKRTLAHKGPEFPILWNHNTDEPIGVGLEMREDERGLWVKGRLLLDVQSGREAYSRAKAKAVKGLSIGYRVIKDAMDGTTRRLREVELYEYSLTVLPMNPLAEIAAVKAGRKLSAKSRESIAAAITTLQALLEESDAAPASEGGKSEPGESHSDDNRETKTSDPDELHSLKQAIESATRALTAA